MDVAMSKVKFNASGEWAYVQNFKVLQSMGSARTLPFSTPKRAALF
jgi:hypothetical protein